MDAFIGTRNDGSASPSTESTHTNIHINNEPKKHFENADGYAEREQESLMKEELIPPENKVGSTVELNSLLLSENKALKLKIQQMKEELSILRKQNFNQPLANGTDGANGNVIDVNEIPSSKNDESDSPRTINTITDSYQWGRPSKSPISLWKNLRKYEKISPPPSSTPDDENPDHDPKQSRLIHRNVNTTRQSGAAVEEEQIKSKTSCKNKLKLKGSDLNNPERENQCTVNEGTEGECENLNKEEIHSFSIEIDSERQDINLSTTANVNARNRIRQEIEEDTLEVDSFKELLIDRSSWLVGLLVLQSLSGFILEKNQTMLQEHADIVNFLTMLVGAGGNAGNQASVRVIRGLAIGTLNARTTPAFLREEAKMALCLSTILGTTGFIRAAVFHTPRAETLAITSSLVAIVTISIGLGSILPLAMKKVRIDPAHSSTTIQVLMDILGVSITCWVSGFVLKKGFFSS